MKINTGKVLGSIFQSWSLTMNESLKLIHNIYIRVMFNLFLKYYGNGLCEMFCKISASEKFEQWRFTLVGRKYVFDDLEIINKKVIYNIYILCQIYKPLIILNLLCFIYLMFEKSFGEYLLNFRRTCLQSRLQASPPTPPKSYLKFRNHRKIPPFVRPNIE